MTCKNYDASVYIQNMHTNAKHYLDDEALLDDVQKIVSHKNYDTQ